MRNIDKKWALFVMATVVSFYGIFYTLINTTFAIKLEVPVDQHFEDMNFYKCVVDAYNLEFSANASYDQMLDYEKLKNLSVLKCDKNENTLVQDKIISVKGIELLTSLKNVSLVYNNISEIDLSNNLGLLSLDVSYNKLSRIDLSRNQKLQFVKLEGNVFENNLYVYKDGYVSLMEFIKFPGDLVQEDIMWSVNSNNVVNVTNNDAYAKENGSTIVKGISSLGFEVINHVNVISISSDKYIIDEENSYIYIENLDDFNIENIKCSDDNVTLELYINNGRLNVKYNDIILKEFKLLETTKDV